MNEDLTVITTAVDNCLDFVGNQLGGLIHTVYSIPDYMIDDTRLPDTSDWRYWKPMKANVSEADLENYERQTGIKLPASYKTFLGYKFFIELNFGHEINLFRHTQNWINENIEITRQWGNEFTIEKGLLPFADYTDWGLVCFDANGKYEDNEYNIVYLDHEDVDTPKEYVYGRFTFMDLIREMIHRLDEWKQRKLIDG